jgi:Pentapeptide repeats (8 copies)
MITIVVSLLVVIFLALFFWFWSAAPRSSVPIHSTPDELRRLEVQDRLRQTSYQVLTAVGLAATFLISMAQFLDSRNHWEADYKTKAEQDMLATFMNAVKLIKDDSSSESAEGAGTNAGVGTLGALAVQDASSRVVQATHILSGFVTAQTRDTNNLLGLSEECKDPWSGSDSKTSARWDTRPEANTAVQTAMRALGDKTMAAYRPHQQGNRCVKPASPSPQLRIEHAGLDALDLSGLDLSCSMLSQSRFRRASLNGANLAFSDLRGARFADYEIPDSPSHRSDGKSAISGINLFKGEADGGPPEWRVYRCWIADLRYARLINSQLDGTAFTGADLRKADFTGANFHKTDLSRANLMDAYGINRDMLKHSCAGIARKGRVDVNAQPVGLETLGSGLDKSARLTPCLIDESASFDPSGKDLARKDIDLPTDDEVQASDIQEIERLKNRSVLEKIFEDYWPSIAPIAALVTAAGLFQLVGIFAFRKLGPTTGILTTLPARFPEKSLRYSADHLRRFVEAYPNFAKLYRVPILFPLDLAVMCSLSAAIAYSSWTWLSAVGMAFPVYSVFLPLLYLVADFVEDIVLFRYLGGGGFDEMNIGRLKRLTLMKMVFLCLSFVQVITCFSLVAFENGHSWVERFKEFFN